VVADVTTDGSRRDAVQPVPGLRIGRVITLPVWRRGLRHPVMVIDVRSKRLLILVLGLALVAGLAGWIFLTTWNPVPTRAEAVGVWQRDDSDEKLTLYPSGKIRFSNIPEGVVNWGRDNHDGKTKPITLTGTWTSFHSESQFLFLSFGPVSGYTVPATSAFLWAKGNDVVGRRLVLYYGESEQLEYDFHRILTNP
jgi:hypothetical protein